MEAKRVTVTDKMMESIENSGLKTSGGMAWQ
jgi:hypothetical protein